MSESPAARATRRTISRIKRVASQRVDSQAPSARPGWTVALAVVVVVTVGFWARRVVSDVVVAIVESQLRGSLSGAVAAISSELDAKRRALSVCATDPPTRDALLRIAADPRGLAELERLGASCLRAGALGPFTLVRFDGVGRPTGVDGAPLPDARAARLVQALATPPRADRPAFVLPYADGAGRTCEVAMPLRDATTHVYVTARFPAEVITRLLQALRAGRSGEAYAVDRDARMISDSRFPEHLRAAGLIGPDAEESSLVVDVRDPGVDLARGERTGRRRRDQPVTRLVREAFETRRDVSASGYRDYRGVFVVGAARVLPGESFAVVLELDREETDAPVIALERMEFVVGSVGILVVIGWVLSAYAAARASRRAKRAESSLERLGQYVIERKIGEGGMGSVYLAHHALLKRPTAVKLIRSARVGSDSLARFEREVQRTSQLTHPNTVAIFDYGRTEDGTFYYVMEYLEGLDLERLVETFGPMPSARVIHVVRQVAAALGEAHESGLVHRDVKPSNVVLCRRGGVDDVVKLLDFGLVKDEAEQRTRLTMGSDVLGTPEFMSPEMFDRASRVEAPSDIYALGAVAYYLVTGTLVFDGTLAELCTAHLTSPPESPSARLGEPVDPVLERVILACLAKDPRARPSDVATLLAALDGSAAARAWTDADARAFWTEHRERIDEVRKAAAGAGDSSSMPRRVGPSRVG